jgi:hypothetical protein
MINCKDNVALRRVFREENYKWHNNTRFHVQEFVFMSQNNLIIYSVTLNRLLRSYIKFYLI